MVGSAYLREYDGNSSREGNEDKRMRIRLGDY